MDLLQRYAAHFSTSHTQARIYLDPDEARREQARKAYAHHVFQIPLLRAFGLMLTALCVLLHNLYLVPTPSAWTDFWRLLLIYTLYVGTFLAHPPGLVQQGSKGPPRSVFFCSSISSSSSWPFIIPVERKAGSFSY